MSQSKNKFKILLFLGCLALVLPINGQNTAKPMLSIVREGGVDLQEGEKEIFEGDSESGNAPLEVMFYGQLEIEEGITARCDWDVTGPEEFRRSVEETSWIFNSSGTYKATFKATFYNEEGEVVGEFESDDITFTITESSLKVPNAFSPNGDGINDVFKVSHQSLIKFNAYVFNRWGQELYRWGIGNIDEGWDGTYKGKTVKDGVYFIVVEAEGSDGVKYKHKGDINVLTGLGDGNYSSGGE